MKIRFLSMTLAVALAFAPGLSSAQDIAEPNVAVLLENVSAAAVRLNGRVSNLSERIDASATSAEEGAKVLDEMLASARELQESLSQDSDIWSDLNALISSWEDKRTKALSAAEANPEFKAIAVSWQDKIDRAIALRKEILTQAAENRSLIDAIESRRDVVLAYYDLGQAERVLETLQGMTDDFAVMNSGMNDILELTGAVADEPIAQQ